MMIPGVGLRITLIGVIISNLFSKLGDALIDLKREILVTVLSSDEGSLLYRIDGENRWRKISV